MSNRIRTGPLIVLSVLALLAASCQTLNAPATTSSQTASGTPGRPVTASSVEGIISSPKVVGVIVGLDGQKITLSLDPAHVNPGDKIVWFSDNPDLTIRFTTLPNPSCDNGHGRCWMNVPVGKKGTHKYDVTLNVDGKVHTLDPDIIIDY